MVVAVLSFAAGLILDTVTRGRREIKLLAYLAHDAVAERRAPLALGEILAVEPLHGEEQAAVGELAVGDVVDDVGMAQIGDDADLALEARLLTRGGGAAQDLERHRQTALVVDALEDVSTGPAAHTRFDGEPFGLLTRIVEKGYLAVEQDRGVNYYTPAVDRESIVRLAAEDFVDNILAGEVANLEILNEVLEERKTTRPRRHSPS